MIRTAATIATLTVILAGCGSDDTTPPEAEPVAIETITITETPDPAAPAPAETVTVEAEPAPAETVTVEAEPVTDMPAACADIMDGVTELDTIYRDRIMQASVAIEDAAMGTLDLDQITADTEAFIAASDAATLDLAATVLECEPDQD